MGSNLELLPVREFALALFVIRVASGFDALAGGILDFSHDRNALKVEHMAEEPRRPRPRESRGQFSNGAESYFAVRSCSRLATVASVGQARISRVARTIVTISGTPRGARWSRRPLGAKAESRSASIAIRSRHRGSEKRNRSSGGHSWQRRRPELLSTRSTF